MYIIEYRSLLLWRLNSLSVWSLSVYGVVHIVNPRSSSNSLNLLILLVNFLWMSSSRLIEAESLGDQIGQAYSTRFLIRFFSRGNITDVFLLLKVRKVIPDICLALLVMIVICSWKERFAYAKVFDVVLK